MGQTPWPIASPGWITSTSASIWETAESGKQKAEGGRRKAVASSLKRNASFENGRVANENRSDQAAHCIPEPVLAGGRPFSSDSYHPKAVVWDLEDIRDLIDSILNGYPIGAAII